MYINDYISKQHVYDAIVIGSGISGGWAAMELCKKGLKTLLLDRGRDVKHVVDYPTAMLHPWEFKLRLNNDMSVIRENPIQSKGFDDGNRLFYVNDKEQPYIQQRPFNWFRGNQVGGRSLVWGRQCYRLSDLDFEANVKDGVGIDWPIRYKDIESWYEYVERYIGVSGRREGLTHLPDGAYLPPMELNCIEQHLEKSIKEQFNRVLTIARVANLTKGWHGRGPCLYRNLCSRGCPYGGYFSSNSATIPQAMETGNLTLRPFSLVTEIIYDKESNKAKGVRVIDTETGDVYEYYARIIFLNASTIASAAILLNSKSDRFPDGLGNDSDQIGRNLMDHHSSAGASGIYEGYQDYYYKGRRPCGFLIPRFRNVGENHRPEFVRGYQIQGIGSRDSWQNKMEYLSGFGKKFKDELTKPGVWSIWMGGWGECLPYSDNRITLDKDRLDKWGMPLIAVNFSYRENEARMKEDIREVCAEMLRKSGFEQVNSFDYDKPGGNTVHEMGTVRMGNDPKTSVLNKYNQIHAVKNVFITDGSCMTSSACQNPSLTYMALTARACTYAYELLKKREL
ncbi:oxidoreductase [Parapedobacter defluvii]|uniref:Oxidoreductase n=1 Tax=Parapedobacter defluvii TaxID=2045106 RepID=A0ABQ1LUT8_9SPHI|nr:GMC family oxidoreductase [Parapedobacter defluvii]GGC30022.1 oxidoreductase [Parapedobacter defluvii]